MWCKWVIKIEWNAQEKTWLEAQHSKVRDWLGGIRLLSDEGWSVAQISQALRGALPVKKYGKHRVLFIQFKEWYPGCTSMDFLLKSPQKQIPNPRSQTAGSLYSCLRDEPILFGKGFHPSLSKHLQDPLFILDRGPLSPQSSCNKGGERKRDWIALFTALQPEFKSHGAMWED